MRIELKHNQLVIVLSKAETKFLTHKADAAGQKEVITYIKALLLKALDLKAFEDEAIIKLANDFNLSKIKNITVELNQRQKTRGADLAKEQPSSMDDEKGLVSEDDLVEEALEEELLEKDTKEAAIDDLLADLLDQGLLKGHPKTPKSRKHSPRQEKHKD